MAKSFNQRLDEILPRLLNPNLLRARGIGNDIGFYIFEYPPDSELAMRSRLRDIETGIARQRPDMRVLHVNMFDFVIDHLRERRLLDKAIEMQRTKGDAALRSALSAALHAERLIAAFCSKYAPDRYNLVLLSGIGSVYPLVRSHSLLNNLHSVMNGTPLVMFYPGSFDGNTLRLFNLLKDENYYRAFKLVP